MGSQRLKQQPWSLQGYVAGSLIKCFSLMFTVELLIVGAWLYLTLLPAFGIFLLLCCLVQHWYGVLCLLLMYPSLSHLAVISWRSTLFWRGKGRWRGNLRQVQRGKTGWDVLYGRRIYLQLQKWKKKENLSCMSICANAYDKVKQ